MRHAAAVAALAVGLATAAADAFHASDITPESLTLLQRWDEAVRTHEPGKLDEAIDRILAITLADRRTLDPAMRLFVAALTGQAPDTSNELERRVVRRAVDSAASPGLVSFLKRGAMLHLDAAIAGEGNRLPEFAPPSSATGSKTSPLLATRRMTVSRDGTILGIQESDWNWPFARSLLDLLHTSAPADTFPAAWFHTSAAYMFERGLFAEIFSNLAHAARLLPDDPLVLFDRASYLEIQGLPLNQVLLRDADTNAIRRYRQGTARLPPNATEATRRAARLDIPGRDEANADAERLYRRALKSDARLTEARVRLARLLIERRQYEEAAAELRTALGETQSPAIRFYAYLFAGRADQALGRLDAAAASFAEAVKLYPSAQSALLAQSQLAVIRADAAGALEPVAKLPPDPDGDIRTGDPWWAYRLAAGREWENLYEALKKTVK